LYPHYHIANTVEFLKKINTLKGNDWKKKYEDFFDYYNKFDIVDFMVLYLFRSIQFSTIFEEEVDANAESIDASNLLYEHFSFYRMQLLKKDGLAIDWNTYVSVREKIGTSSEQEFLAYFHTKLKFDNQSIKLFKNTYKRLHRNAERDRLFIYDMIFLLASGYIKIGKEKNFLVDISKSIPGMAKYLANHLYNGNVSQVYRAAKEAEERISLFNGISRTLS